MQEVAWKFLKNVENDYSNPRVLTKLLQQLKEAAVFLRMVIPWSTGHKREVDWFIDKSI